MLPRGSIMLQKTVLVFLLADYASENMKEIIKHTDYDPESIKRMILNNYVDNIEPFFKKQLV
jgi:hypothetical protein